MKRFLLLAAVFGSAWCAGSAAKAAPVDVMQPDLSARMSRPADAPAVERGRADDSQLAHGWYGRGYYRGPTYHHHHNYHHHGYYRGYHHGPSFRYQGFYGPRVYYGYGHGRIIYGW
jgi:hypothetical protein